MKTKCVNANDHCDLTLNKIYEVLKPDFYNIIADDGTPQEFHSYRFEDYVEPKEEIKVEEKSIMKVYTTGQMVDLLFENMERVGKILKANYEYSIDQAVVFKNNKLYWVKGGNLFVVCEMDKDTKWRIIEPEPKKVSFVEAFKSFKDGCTVKSATTDISFGIGSNHIGLHIATCEEIDGEWIVLD
jgi:hypothetical protein